jgi:hypothetical protein
VCWLGTLRAGLYLVMLPMGLAWLFNIVCFVLALHLIRQSGRVHRKAVVR